MVTTAFFRSDCHTIPHSRAERWLPATARGAPRPATPPGAASAHSPKDRADSPTPICAPVRWLLQAECPDVGAEFQLAIVGTGVGIIGCSPTYPFPRQAAAIDLGPQAGILGGNVSFATHCGLILGPRVSSHINPIRTLVVGHFNGSKALPQINSRRGDMHHYFDKIAQV